MSNLYISEFSSIAAMDARMVPVQAAEQPGYDQAVITVSSTSAQSKPFQSTTRFVRLHTDGIISYLVGQEPIATTANARMVAGQTEYFGVIPGQILAAITNT